MKLLVLSLGGLLAQAPLEDSNDPNSLYYADDYYYDDGYYYDNYTDYNIADQLGRSTRGRKTKRPKRVRPTRPNRVRPERPVRPKNPKRRTTTTTSTTTTTTTTTKNNPDVLKEVDLTLLYQQYEYENNAQAVQLNADYGEYGDLYGGISNKFGENTLDTGLDPENNLAEGEPEDRVPPESPETPSPVLEAPVAPPTVTESVTIQEVAQQENEVDESRVAAIVEEVVLNQAQEVSKQITEQKVEVNQINQAFTESSQPPVAISNSENAVINQRVVAPPKAKAQKPAPIPQRLTPVSAPTAEDQANWPVRQAYSQQRRPVRQNAPIPMQNSGRNYNTPTTGGDPYTTAAPTLKCWHCDAMSFEECEAKGEERPCHANEGSCFLEIRERRDSNPFMQICMGCKAVDACDNMQNQNFQNANPAWTQCRPESEYSDSVCRQCCTDDNCTKDPTWWYPTTREEWAFKG